MALLTLRVEGDPILRKKAKPVNAVNDKIRALLDAMVETMKENQGVGLAAPQIGRLRRLITVDVGEGVYKMVNPEILERSEEQQLDIEGCLSVPHYNGTVYRPQSVTVSYQDEEGVEKTVKAEGLFARCLCHEIDHLNGVLFRDLVEEEIDLAHPTDEQKAYLRAHHLLDEEDEETEVEQEEASNSADEAKGEQ